MRRPGGTRATGPWRRPGPRRTPCGAGPAGVPCQVGVSKLSMNYRGGGGRIGPLRSARLSSVGVIVVLAAHAGPNLSPTAPALSSGEVDMVLAPPQRVVASILYPWSSSPAGCAGSRREQRTDHVPQQGQARRESTPGGDRRV